MIIQLLASFGIMFFLKDSDIFSFIRGFLIRRSVFLFKLFECSFCIGFHTGYIVYFLNYQVFSFREMIIFSFASAAFCYITYVILDRISREL